MPRAHLWHEMAGGMGSSQVQEVASDYPQVDSLPRGRNLIPPSCGNKVGGSWTAWPCHSPELLAGFETFPAASSPPPPWVANRGSLVPAPIELPCSLHTKNGNPQAILGAVPSQAVATVSLLPSGCWTLLSLVPSPAYIGTAKEHPAEATDGMS